MALFGGQRSTLEQEEDAMAQHCGRDDADLSLLSLMRLQDEFRESNMA